MSDSVLMSVLRCIVCVQSKLGCAVLRNELDNGMQMLK